MIPRDHILEWRAQAPWPQDSQIEQDLVISRALVAIFSNDILHDALAFRGGTALYKLYLPAARYSQDIDLVRTGIGPAKPMMDALHDVLNSWLGQPKTTGTNGGAPGRPARQRKYRNVLRGGSALWCLCPPATRARC